MEIVVGDSTIVVAVFPLPGEDGEEGEDEKYEETPGVRVGLVGGDVGGDDGGDGWAPVAG